MAKVIFGCGYLGLRVGRLWREAGQRVVAVTRSAQKAQRLAADGLEPVVGDIVLGPAVALPPGIDNVLFSVGYERAAPQRSGPTIHEVYVGGLANVLEWLPASVERFIYISSTGVYGQVHGEEVDEDSPCRPTREGGKACLAAEELLRGSRFGSRAIVLRLAGLYGPGRIPRAMDLVEGEPIDAPADGWLNLIHVEDAARIVLLAEARSEPPRTYVVSDGHFVQRRAYYEELARLLGAPPPQFVDPPAASPAAQRATSDKRASPRRMLAELEPELRYPSYREGLAAIVRGGDWSGAPRHD